MSYIKAVEECRLGLQDIKYKADKYYDDYIRFKNTLTNLDTDRKNALQDYNDATLLLANTPKTKKFEGQDYYSWRRPDSCYSLCSNKKYYGVVKDSSSLPVEVNSLPYEEIYVSSDPMEVGPGKCDCTPIKKDCFCSVVDEITFNTRKEDEKVKWDKYVDKRKIYFDYLEKEKPVPPSSFNVNCCINKNDCEEGSKCLGIIQGCEQGLSNALLAMNEQEREELEKNFMISCNNILDASLALIQDFNNNVIELDKNLVDIKNAKSSTTDTVNTIYNKIITIYIKSENIYNIMKSKIDEFNIKKTQAYTNKISTSFTSKYKNAIYTAYSSILLNFNNIFIKFSEATDLFIQTKIEYNDLNNYKNIFENINKINEDINIIKNNIKNEFSKINTINDNVNQKKNSIIEEDIKLIETLSNNSNNILNLIDNYMKDYKENINKVKYYVSILSDSIYNKDSNNLYNSILNEETIIIQEYNKNKNLIDEIKKTSDNLKNDISIYENILNYKKEINNIIPSIDNDYKIINNLNNSINNIIVNNEDDLIKLENIKNDILNFNKNIVESFHNIKFKIETFDLNSDSKLSKNIKLINNLKDSSNKLFNKISTNSIFFNKIKELNENINSIVENNDKKNQDIINMINNINNIYYEKKGKYINDSIIDKNQINSDILLYNEIKKDESLFQKSMDNQNYNILYIIIVIIIILIISMIFFYS
jgi:hypothetical protein